MADCLMGAELTQHPELFGAVVSHVGIYDMLRVELQPNGAFNVTEFGTVKELDQFKALYAYSPYHHVVDGTNYPPVLVSDRRQRSARGSVEFAQDDRPLAGQRNQAPGPAQDQRQFAATASARR